MILCESNAKKQGEDSLTQTCGRQTDMHGNSMAKTSTRVV